MVELKNGKARRVLHQHPAVMPEPDRKVFVHGAEVFPINPLLIGINGIALSPDARTLYWTVTAGSKLHAMSTAQLRKGKTGKMRDLGADNALYFTANYLNNHCAGAMADGQERSNIWKPPLPVRITGGSRASR